MAVGRLQDFIRQLRQVVGAERDGGLSDAALLERFAARRDEAAFEVLLWRHGPMVLGVCRRLLARSQDVEDAFQATFLVLVKKAGAVRKRGSLGSWLYKVAYRLALRARADAARRAAVEKPGVERAAGEATADFVWRDLRPVLDAEVHGLPARYRAAFVLCYLEGKTNAEAARELGCPVGTVLSRLAWARQRLRDRLTRRGLALSAGLLAGALSQSAASATVPAALAGFTLGAARLFAAGRSAGAASAHAAALAEGVLRAMFRTKLKIAAAVLVAVGLLGTGAGVAVQRGEAKPADVKKEQAAPVPQERDAASAPAAKEKEAAAAPVPKEEDKDRVEVASQRDGLVVVVGREVKDGEKVPPERVVTAKVGGVEKKYYRWKEGDTVEEGQLLMRLDDRLAREEVAIKMERLNAAEADLRATEKTCDEARERRESVKKAFQNGGASREEMRGAELTAARYELEAVAKRGQVGVAKGELRQAQTILEMHEVRSPARGVIQIIYKKVGEGVKSYEPVMRIKLTEKR